MKKVDEFYILDTIQNGFVPAWYELSFREKLTEGDIRCDAPVFVLRIYRKIIDTLFKKTAELARLDVWMPLRSTFLFERVPRRKDEGMFHEIVIPLPRTVSGWDEANDMCERLSDVLAALRCVEYCVSGTAPQLFTVALGGGKYQRFLGGDITPAFAGWLSSLPVRGNINIKEATTSMIAAYNYICAVRKKKDDFGFRAWAETNGGFRIQCPGNACTLHPSSDRADFQSLADGNYEGYEWGCHNIDSPLQQLTLLAGLAALSDLARKAGAQ